jgi:WD domain, G-beta repeat/Planctomycete cytochrome C
MFRSRHSCCCILCSLLGLALAWLMFSGSPPAAQAQAPKGAVSFINDVAPILKENCFACHDAKKKKGKFEMTSYAKFREGGSKDDPVTPGASGDSVIIHLLTATNASRMPPKEAGEALAKDKVAVIAKWIDEGAKLDPGIDPKGELMRELRIRWKPPQPPVAYKTYVNINALIFSPDNKKLIVGGYHELTVWDIASAKLEKRIWTRAERAYGMAFLPDGKLIVAGGRPGQEGDVRVYNLAGNSKMTDGVAILDGVNDKSVLIKELLETDDSVYGVAVSPDGKNIASGGCDRIVRIWDVSAGLDQVKLTDSIENHADWVLALSFSPDGKHIATASRDKTAKVWDIAAKESVLTFPDHQEPVFGVAISLDGKSGISAAQDKNVRWWQATDAGKNIGKQIRAGGGHAKAVFRLAYYPDAKKPLLATCSADTTIRLWDPNNGTMLKSLTGLTDWAYAVAISPDGTMVAGGSYKGEVRIWKTADGALVKDFNASPGYVAAKVTAGK